MSIFIIIFWSDLSLSYIFIFQLIHTDISKLKPPANYLLDIKPKRNLNW